jgi:hypothetical protein
LIINFKLERFCDDFEFLDLLEIDGASFEDLSQQEKALFLKLVVAECSEQTHGKSMHILHHYLVVFRFSKACRFSLIAFYDIFETN